VPLTSIELSELGRDLERLVETLQESLAGTAEAARPVELDQPSVGRVSRIDAIQQQKMLEANRQAQLGRLQLARAALRRFEEDEFGDCMGCGEDVGFARLKARPESAFCIQCQTARERD
jgi:DnaK suppressor protein